MARLIVYLRTAIVVAFALNLSACVTTEELYAEYSMEECNIVASREESGAIELHEQTTDTRYPWEPAVYFDFDSSELSAMEKDRLDKSMQVLKQFAQLRVSVQGFTDNVGSTEYNLGLAEKRVAAVTSYLAENGIASNRVLAQPIGEIAVLADEKSALNDTDKRRVELMLIDQNDRALEFQISMNGPS